MKPDQSLMPRESIEKKILLIRGKRVLLDSDLAYLYGVPAKRLNEQVRRNVKRFPDDFMFQLTSEEYRVLRSQIATLKMGRGLHRKYIPHVFTEQGVAMLSSVLNSERALQVNIAIMRAFVKLREVLLTDKEFALKLKELEIKTKEHDEEIQTILEAIRRLMERPLEPPKRHIGFEVKTS